MAWRVLHGSILRFGCWVVAAIVVRPGLVESLLLLEVFVAAPVAIEVLASLRVSAVTEGSAARLVAAARLVMLPAAIALAASFAAPTGVAAGLLALPWAATTGVLGVAAVADRLDRGLRFDHALVSQGALGFAAVGGLLTLDQRFALNPFGFGSFLTLLAGVHFTVAGLLLLTAASVVAARWPGRVPLVASACAIVGGPLTAIGFFGLPALNALGAVLTVSGGFILGLYHLAAVRGIRGPAWACVAIAGLSLLVSMPLAAGWAVGLATGSSLLPLELMTRVHGGLNAVGFGLLGMIGWRAALVAENHGR